MAAADSLPISITMIFCGCMFNLITTEYVLRADPGAGNLLTLAEISMVLLQRIPGRISRFSAYGIKPFVTPLAAHLQFTILWSMMSVLANMAFAYKISIPIFTLIRSCNLIATVMLGRLVFGQRYSKMQLFCVTVVSAGIFMASYGEATSLKRTKITSSCTDCAEPLPPSGDDASSHSDSYFGELTIWYIGVSILAFVQFVQGLLGHIQARFYKIYSHLSSKGELVDEFMFSSHVVALLPFFFMRQEIGAVALTALQSEPLPLPVISLLPSTIVWLVLTSLSQSVCLTGVFRTSAIVSPLSLTIILSVRKFFSVLVSVLWFGNVWSHWHSMSTILIFGGVFAYSQAPEAQMDSASSAKKAA